ncbi:MAG: DUF2927 domain-containing protein [Phaeodactylibacter sp.]|nr:DUF2927 domain-containing protein [Phaeodactylibacter sp.]
MSQILYRNIAPRGIILLILIALLPQLSSCSEENQEPPYKATTVEECINEEACVWDHFEHIGFGSEDKTAKYYGIMKWDKEIRSPRIAILEDKYREKYQSRFIEIAEKINALTGLEMGINERYKKYPPKEDSNSFVFFARNMKNPLKENDRAITQLFKGNKLFHKLYYNYYSQYKDNHPVCVVFRLNRVNQPLIVNSVFFFPETIDKELLNACFEEELVQNLGLTDYKKGKFTAFIDSSKHTKNTDLDWLLLTILYHPDVKRGMDVDDVQKIFSKVYKDSLKKFNQYRNGGLDDARN